MITLIALVPIFSEANTPSDEITPLDETTNEDEITKKASYDKTIQEAKALKFNYFEPGEQSL